MHIQGATAVAYERDIENALTPGSSGVKRKPASRRSPHFRNVHALAIENLINRRDTLPLLVDIARRA